MFSPTAPAADLQEVINASWFTVEAGIFIYTRVADVTNENMHLMVIRDATEITVVTLEENMAMLGDHEANGERWKLLNIRCGKPFYCVGFIAYITGALARNGIDIVITSTFSNDLVMVMEKDVAAAIKTLVDCGFRLKN